MPRIPKELRGGENAGKRRGIKKLGYEEWRKREIERLVLRSGVKAETKLEFMDVIRG